MAPQELAGIAEVAAMFGVSRQTAHKYARHAAFPEPLDRLASGPVWRLADVEAWGREHRPLRAGRPPGRRDREDGPTTQRDPSLEERVAESLATLPELSDWHPGKPIRQDRLGFAVGLLALKNALDLERRVDRLERRDRPE